MLRSEEWYVQREIKDFGGLDEIDESIKLIQEYLNKDYYKSKNERLKEWNPDKGEIYELVLAIFAAVICNREMTYQALCGMLAGRIDVKEHIDAVKIVAECAALISKTGLIEIERNGSGKYIMVKSQYEIDNIPELEKHQILTDKPKTITKNLDDEYGSMILGGKHNHHDECICLDHLNRMNQIELKLNRELLRKYEEAPTYALDTPEKKDQWENFIRNSYRAYIKLVRGGNRFYLLHRYDKRGRCYAEGYHITTQGSSFKKAIIELAQEEVVTI